MYINIVYIDRSYSYTLYYNNNMGKSINIIIIIIGHI